MAEITALLNRLQNQIDSGEVDRAIETLLSLVEQIEQRRLQETSQYVQALIAIYQKNLSQAKRRSLYSLVSHLTEIQFHRSQFLLATALALGRADLESAPPVSDLAKRERAVGRKLENSSEIVDGIELPTILILSDVPNSQGFTLSDSRSLHIRIMNVGNERAGNVSLRTRSQEGIVVEPETTEIGHIPSEGQQDIQLALQSSEPGTYFITFLLFLQGENVDIGRATVTIGANTQTARTDTTPTGTQSSDSSGIPDWGLPVGGIGALGIGLGVYRYLNWNDDD